MESVNRILISRMKYIGDIVLTTPIVRAVRERYSDAFIAYLGDKEAVSLLERNPHLNEIIPYDFSRPTLIEQPRVMWLLYKRKFDAVVDLFSNPRSALLMYASGAPVRIGKDVKGRGKLYTRRVHDDGKSKTAIQFNYQYMKPLGVEPTHFRTEIFLTEEEKREARIFLKWQEVDVDKPIVGLHPGATWPAKMWQAEKFAELANRLVDRLGVQVVITQGPKEQSLIEEIKKRVAWRVKFLGALPLRQLAAVLSQLSVYVANDSGPMHIAVAVGTKTIGIFGLGEENIWFPYTPPYYDEATGHIALRKDVPCHPCHLDYCNRGGEDYMECMKRLGVEEVLEEVRKRIDNLC